MAGQIMHPYRWRLYFNSRQAAPLVCSLDNGDTGTEFSVRQAILHDIKHVFTTYLQESELRQSHPDLSRSVPLLHTQPLFCMEFEAELKMEFGIAHFYPTQNMPEDFVRMGGLAR